MQIAFSGHLQLAWLNYDQTKGPGTCQVQTPDPFTALFNVFCQSISNASLSGSGGQNAAGRSWYQKDTDEISSISG